MTHSVHLSIHSCLQPATVRPSAQLWFVVMVTMRSAARCGCGAVAWRGVGRRGGVAWRSAERGRRGEDDVSLAIRGDDVARAARGEGDAPHGFG